MVTLGFLEMSKLEAPETRIEEPLVCALYYSCLCTRGTHPLTPEVADFRPMQMKPGQVLSKPQSEHCLGFGTATYAECGLTEMHTLSAKLITLDTCSSHARVAHLVLAQNTGDKCSVYVDLCISVGNLPVYQNYFLIFYREASHEKIGKVI